MSAVSVSQESAGETEATPVVSDSSSSQPDSIPDQRPEADHPESDATPKHPSSSLEASTADSHSPDSNDRPAEDAVAPALEPTVEPVETEATTDKTESQSDSVSHSTAEKQDAVDVDSLNEEIKSLIEKLTVELENGQLRECISLYEKCQARIHKLAELKFDARKLNKIRKKINAVYFQMKELKDWRHWGIEQSRNELIEKLENLAQYKGDPRQLHSQLKNLRELWNGWIQSGDFPNRTMRDRYSQAYEKAFEPCKQYFKQQKKLRKANKKLRKQICKELEAFFDATDWNRPDWSQVNEILRNSRNQWKKAIPLNKSDWNSTNARFDAVMEKFEPCLERERARGIRFREDLIAQANALDSEPVKIATERVKGLQKEWKTVVIRDRKRKESQLWKQFSVACDRQFQRRSEIRQAAEERKQVSKKEKIALISEMRELNKIPPEKIKDSAPKASEIRRKWSDAAKTDRRQGRDSLESKFNHEVARFQQNLHHSERLHSEAKLSILESKAAICDEMEIAAISGDAQSDIDAFHSKWSSITDDCGEFEQAIQSRFESACALMQDKSDTAPKDSGHWQENLVTKLDICLKLEILAKIDSPAEFARDRIQANVARLKAAMVDHDQASDPEAETRQLLAEFWLTGAVPEQEYESLNSRFSRIRAELSKDT